MVITVINYLSSWVSPTDYTTYWDLSVVFTKIGSLTKIKTKFVH